MRPIEFLIAVATVLSCGQQCLAQQNCNASGGDCCAVQSNQHIPPGIFGFSPLPASRYFSTPTVETAGVWLYDMRSTNFCPVTLCHGTCSWRRSATDNYRAPCPLIGFDHMVKEPSGGCCGGN